MKRSKRYNEAVTKVDRSIQYGVEDAVKILKQVSTAKFDETIEIAMRLGVDPRHAEQMVRGTVALPHGTGKTVQCTSFNKGK